MSVAKVVGAVVVAAVVLVGGSYLTGSMAERGFREAAAKRNQNPYGVAVNVVEYKRGVFGATARTEVVLPAAAEGPAFPLPLSEPLTVVFEHEITHGPLLTLVSAARVHTRLRLPDESAARLGELFGGDPFAGKAPLTIDTSVGWDGDVRNRILSPAFEATSKDEAKAKVSWGGIDGEFNLSSNLTRSDMNIVFAGFSLATADDKNKIRVGRATLKGDMDKGDGYEFIGSGSSILHLDQVAAIQSGGEDTLHLALDLGNLEMKTLTSLNDGVLEAEVRFSANRIAVEGETKETIEDAALTFAYTNIDAKALDIITQNARNGQDDEVREAMQEQMGALLQRKPAIFVKDVSARWPEGETKLDFRLGYVGSGDLAPTDFEAELHLSLPRALVVRLLGSQIYENVADNLEDGEASEENIQNLVKARVDRQIAVWAENNLLVEKEDGALRADAQFRAGALNLNGKEAPLETLWGLLPR